MSPQELGNLLLTRRKQLRLTRSYVAALADISARQLLAWEACRGNPSFRQLQAVLAALGFSLKIELTPVP